MKYDITQKTLALIGFCFVFGGLMACGNQIGDGGKDNSDNDNSNNIITNGSSSKTDQCDVEMTWKPISESDGKLVVLFESGAFFNEVWAENLLGGFEPGTSAGFTNGGRLTIRFSKEGSEYTGRIIADECEFKVDEPAERQE